MRKQSTLTDRGRAALAAMAIATGGMLAAVTVQAAPLAPAAAETIAGEAGATAVHWHGGGWRHGGWRHGGWRHGGGWHEGWRHRHGGWGHRHHGGWRHRW